MSKGKALEGFAATTLVLIALLLATVVLPVAPRVLVDTSDSLPGTLFLRLPEGSLRVGDVVAFCLGEEDARLALERGYLRPIGGRCGHQVLLKAVMATGGVALSTRDRRLTVDGAITSLGVQEADSAGRDLRSPYGAAESILGDDEYFLVGTHPRSWDSRYFGVVSGSQILGRYRPLSRQADRTIRRFLSEVLVESDNRS